MFDELNKYKTNGHFFLTPTDSLEEVCNAPDDKAGVYVVYELKNGRIRLVYMGPSGTVNPGGATKEGLVGLKAAIVYGTSAEKTPRTQSWPVKLLSENIDALDIYWWVTFGGKLKDHPADVIKVLYRAHKGLFGELPKWNQRGG
jgi:hypothetical protein